MLKVRKENLLIVNGAMWLAIGTKIALTGLGAYRRLHEAGAPIWWQVIVSVLVFAGFFFMFRRVASRYTERILSFKEERRSIIHTFSLKGYLIIAFMISLGITLKHIPGISDNFFSSFYLGLGPGLMSAGVRFLLARLGLGKAGSKRD